MPYNGNMGINYWYEYAKINSLKPVEKYLLIKKFNDAESFYNCSDDEIVASGIIDRKKIDQIRAIRFDNNAREMIKKNNISIISINDFDYPVLLKQIYDPPVVLFLKGNVSLLQKKMIAIVGSRKHSDYSKSSTAMISKELSENDYVIVSGMAKGIDSIAHENVKNGNTVAVLGFGFDHCYPREHYMLMKNLIKNSLVISEFIMEVKPEKKNFPMRNRIISGLCFATIIIEAAIKSGSLITAEFSIENGREVFVLPQPIDSNSEGSNLLIKDGASIITTMDTLIEEIKKVEIS